MNLYFNKLREYDNNIDYAIFDDDVNIGCLEITYHTNHIFIRYLRINEDMHRKGYATAVMDYVLDYYKLPVCLCVNHNLSAKGFWENYFRGKNVVKGRGTIYTIYV